MPHRLMFGGLSRRFVRTDMSVVTAAGVLWLMGSLPVPAVGDDAPSGQTSPAVAPQLPNLTAKAQSVLTSTQSNALTTSMDNALEFIARTQNSNGSFPTKDSGQPGVTALCALAFMSRGHEPGKGQYGRPLISAVHYVLSFQDPTTGAIMALKGSQRVPLQFRTPYSREAHYSHAISGHMLAEVYRRSDAESRDQLRKPIELALQYAYKHQFKGTAENGGWRYAHIGRNNNADLSVTSWMMMFLHAAKMAEFSGPDQWLNESRVFVTNTYDRQRQGFMYALRGDERTISRGTMGAGMLCMSLAGQPQTEAARRAGALLIHRPFERYNFCPHIEDRYHYSAFFCSQGMLQLGGREWSIFFPDLVDVLTENQYEDGSWDSETHPVDVKFGKVYTTALSVLALSPGYQQLAIQQFER